MKTPSTIIYKRDDTDYVGVELQLVKVTEIAAYYVRFSGHNSCVKCLFLSRLDTVLSGTHRTMFANRSDLRKAVTKHIDFVSSIIELEKNHERK